jgi:aminoglycoside/choline kinase family phosphotransferase
MKEEEKKIISLFEQWSGEKLQGFSPLPVSGSARRYFRLSGIKTRVIGAYNKDIKENKAFFYLSSYFKKSRLNVPKVLAKDTNNGIYLIEDLGNTTLYSLLMEKRDNNCIPDEIITYYKRTIEALVKFQTTVKGLDFKKCYPRPAFDSQSIMWDLNYFKYYFLKLAKIEFNEQLLENDFTAFSKYLLQADSRYFLYRDMNSRNIMVKDNEVYFIDYQGGRKGALQYDIASLLYDAKANLPQSLRDELLDYYLDCLNKVKKVNRKIFLEHYHGFVLIRILQALGAYGFRGYFERKDHFLKSIPFAVRNLDWMMRNKKLKMKTPYLLQIVDKIIHSDEIRKYEWNDNSVGRLTVQINSFSYREKIPVDLSGNGGGFVFDCRGIVNPGRFDEYKQFNGMDKNVQDFLNGQPSAKEFLDNSFNLVDQSIDTYLKRNFNNLMVNYGCTGGQHRSVYSAEKLAEHLSKKPGLIVELNHTKLNVSKTFNK